MFLLVDTGITQLPKSDCDKLELTTSYIYVCKWYMDLYNQLDNVHNIQLVPLFYGVHINWQSCLMIAHHHGFNNRYSNTKIFF